MALNVTWRAALILMLALQQVNGQALRCVSCHAQETAAQLQTSMAHALTLPRSNPLFQTHRDMSVTKGHFTYRVSTEPSATTYSVSDGISTISAPVIYVFGAHNQTYLLEYQGRTYESLVSYYVGPDALDTTIGDQVIQPANLEQAFGRPLHTGEREDCTSCHSSSATGDLTLPMKESGVLGVSCERCHADALKHQAAALQGSVSHLPIDLGKKTPTELNEVCGQCHRTWESVLRGHNTGRIDNVRMQPYRLTNSKCFDGLDLRLSCITCHDPHQHGKPSVEVVDRKCLACHAVGAPVTAVEHEHPKVCPVSTNNCAGCHMPKTPLMDGNIAFSDHQIRIVHPGDPYPN